MSMIGTRAPDADISTDYDRLHVSLYAALLDANAVGEPWQTAATRLMALDPSAPDAEACWRSHLERARWIVGPGLASAIDTFGTHRTED